MSQFQNQIPDCFANFNELGEDKSAFGLVYDCNDTYSVISCDHCSCEMKYSSASGREHITYSYISMNLAIVLTTGWIQTPIKQLKVVLLHMKSLVGLTVICVLCILIHV